MIVEPDFFNHWKVQLLITLVAEAADELCRNLADSHGKPSDNLAITQGYPTGNLALSYGEPWLNPRLIQPEASPLWVQKLWAHCQARKAWEFPGMTTGQLRAICGAPLPPERWRKILIECRWIEVDAEKIVVHEWDVVNASLVRSWRNGAQSGGRPKGGGKPSDNPEGNSVTPRVSDREDREDRRDSTRTREARAREGSVSEGVLALSRDVPFQDLVSDAQKKVCGVLGNTRKTLGDLGVRALGALVTSGELPRPAEDWDLLTWFYGLAPDETDIDLRGRYRDGDRLAQNLMTALERAHQYAKKVGRSPGARTGEAKAVSLSRPPADWREMGAVLFPGAELPADWANLPEHARQTIVDAAREREKERGAAA